MLVQKPSHKIQKKYILLSSTGKDTIKNILLEYLGVLGFAKASVVFVENNIIAVNGKEVDDVRAALELSNENIKILRVSGTLKGLHSKL